MKVIPLLLLVVWASPSFSLTDGENDDTKAILSIKGGNLRSLQQRADYSSPGVSCKACPCGYFDGCNSCGCNEGGFAICTLRACSPEEFGETTCNTCEDRCCDLSDRPKGDDEPPLCCPDGSWASNIGDGTATCPNGLVVTSNENEGTVCQPTCDDCPCGYSDGCNDCSCSGPDGVAACTLLSCLVQGTPSCKECAPVAVDKCCDPLKEPGRFGNLPSREGHQCCGATGEWLGSIGDGKTIFCGDQLISSGYGKPCFEPKCCDLAARPQGAIESPICCPDGSWAGNIGNGSGTCPSGLVVRSGVNEGEVCEKELTCEECPCGYNDGCNQCTCGFGGVPACTFRFCAQKGTPSCNQCLPSDKCCDPRKEPGKFGNPPAFEGYQCCGVTGEWVGSIGDGRTIFCGDRLIDSDYGEPCVDESKCCDLADRPEGAIESPLCCPDGSWVGNIGDGSGTCPNGSTVRSGVNEGDICEPTCESCHCGYNDGCNDCSCGTDGDLIGCTERACLLQGPPSCLECTKEPLCCDPLKEPGQFGNFIGREGHQCCAATGEWTFSIGDAKTYFCGGSYITSGFGRRCYEPTCCDPRELPGANGGPIPFETPLCCFDGNWIGNRGDGRGQCQGMTIDVNSQGEICEDEETFCTQDVMTCPDGSFVGRDPASGCAFFPCPKRCRRRYRWCGYRRGWVGLDPTKNCRQFKPCRQN